LNDFTNRVADCLGAASSSASRPLGEGRNFAIRAAKVAHELVGIPIAGGIDFTFFSVAVATSLVRALAT
jgi:hypothetical protein